ncbi:GNAT family N-acetyltransferase [Micromonospora sp. NPDC023956]|uniref:GNAT family N-acetyltransferase n=1 Tax=Micromonospora sp. NPDC023956 TaxID=3155722 RepID=UPI0033D3F9D7
MSTSRSTSGYRTRVVRSVEELSPQTTDLALAAGASEFYYGHEFLRAYEREPIQPVRDVYYVETYDADGTLLALTPGYVQGDPLRALGLADGELALLSHVWHCSDTQLASVVQTPAVAEAVVGALREVAAAAGLRRFGFINVPTDSPAARALAGAGLTGIDLDTRYWMDLAGMGDWDGYLATLKLKDRGEYRRQLRRADDAGVKIVERAPTRHEDPESLRIFEELMARVGSAGYYSAERIAAFLQYTQKGARIIEVTLGGDLIAKAVVFIETRKIHAWAGGYNRDPALSFSPYYVLMAAIIQLGFRVGVPILEGGRRNPAFKMRFGMVPQPLQAFMATNG